VNWLASNGAHNMLLQGFIFQHCTQHLDAILGPGAVEKELFLQNLAFRDARIIYSGGPLRLKNIYFIDCTFELQPSEPSRF